MDNDLILDKVFSLLNNCFRRNNIGVIAIYRYKYLFLYLSEFQKLLTHNRKIN